MFALYGDITTLLFDKLILKSSLVKKLVTLKQEDTKSEPLPGSYIS